MEEIDIKMYIVEFIKGVVAGPDNRLGPDQSEAAWSEPIVGFCRGDDPTFQVFKDAVGSFHWTPFEAFSLAFPEMNVQPEDLAVIVWILPQTEKTKNDNADETRLPSERWARARIFGEAFNRQLRERVSEELNQQGYAAVAPFCLEQYHNEKSERFGRASTWSERHMAYAAGLGTFGLCDGLITPAGKAIRAGSVVAKITVEPAERPYTNHNAYCLHHSRGTCGECIDRCPVKALSINGHDKIKCRTFLETKTAQYVSENFGFVGYGCGLCQTGVPCESGIPEDLR
jgi:epoxyqueuosine reductase